MKGRSVAIVTGASSGLGVEFARQAARGGCDVVLVARREEPMRALATRLDADFGATSHVLVQDLAEPGSAAAVASEVERLGLEPDILIANAGYGFNGPFVALAPTEATHMLGVNVVSLTDLVRLILPGMLARRRGRIMLLASTAAFQPGPYMAEYCATKAYVLSLGEALAHETRGTGVTVTTACPGATLTGFQAAASVPVDSTLFKTVSLPPAEVARRAYCAMLDGKPVIVPGALNAVGAFFGRVMPRSLVVPLGARLLKKD